MPCTVQLKSGGLYEIQQNRRQIDDLPPLESYERAERVTFRIRIRTIHRSFTIVFIELTSLEILN